MLKVYECASLTVGATVPGSNVGVVAHTEISMTVNFFAVSSVFLSLNK